MGITPEYGEEELLHAQEEDVERQAGSQLPPWEDVGEAEVHEHELAEMETHHRAAIEDEEPSNPADADIAPDFDQSPDGWPLELRGHVTDDQEAEDEKSDTPVSAA